VDFKKYPESRNKYNIVVIFINCLGKCSIIIPVWDIVITKELALLFLTYIVCQVGIPETIVSNQGPQFISDFWSEFYKYIGTKLKLLIANYLQTNSQIEIINQYFDQ
jgi:hypothetical protein